MLRNLSGQSIQTSMQNLESVAQKIAELLHYVRKRILILLLLLKKNNPPSGCFGTSPLSILCAMYLFLLYATKNLEVYLISGHH